MLLLALAMPALAQPAFTPEDVARTRTVRQALVSPDGAQVATVLSEPRLPWLDGTDGPARSHLYMTDPSSGTTRPWITGDHSVSAVAWAPDSSAVHFLAKRGSDEHDALYAIAVGGGEAQRVHGHATAINAYAVSPDGTQLAWLAKPEQDEAVKAAEEKGFDAEVYEEQEHDQQLWVAPLGGEAEAPLALEGHVSDLSWTADRLLVTVAPSPRVDDRYLDRTLVVLDPTGGEVARFDTPGKLGHAALAPDAARLAVIAGESRDDPSAGRLMVARLGEPLVDLLPELEGQVDDFAWLDEDTLAYVASVGCESLVGTVDADGSAGRVVLEPGQLSVSSLDVSRTGEQWALTADTPSHPSEAFWLVAGGEAPKRLTDSNPWLADIPLGEQEVVRWRARDGLEIEGVLVHPLTRAEGERVPLVVKVHGGPEAHDDNGWVTGYSSPGQLAAHKGWAVLYPNYRGSTGRGVAYSKLDQHDYAGREFNDIVDGVKHLVKQGLVDEDKVGITGGSYGGYASAWGATKLTKHYAAAVMFVGISEQISKFGTTDIPNEMYWSHARAWPWDEWRFFDSRSPVRFTKDADTPLLILHGKADTRVHPSQSMTLYRYLKTIGKVPVRLVLYPGEGHGNRRAASRLDYTLRMLRWFTHYLEGGDRHAPAPPPQLDLPLADDDDKATAEVQP